MRAPLFSHLLDRLTPPLLVVPLVVLAATTTGCPEDKPPPIVTKASLKLDVPRLRVTLGEAIDVTFKTTASGGEAATGDVIVTVGPVEGDAVAGDAFVGADAATANSTSVTVTPDAGEGGFVFRCGDAAGRVQLGVTTTDTNLTELTVVSCVEATNFFYEIDDDLDANCSRLQADGVSSCNVTLQIARSRIGSGEDPAPAADEAVDVETIEVAEVEILDGIRGVDPDGIPEVLATAADTPLQKRLVGIQTDAEGNANFLVTSPAWLRSSPCGRRSAASKRRSRWSSRRSKTNRRCRWWPRSSSSRAARRLCCR